MTKTYLEKPAEVQRKWYVIDAEGKTLGRLAARVASVLRGKHKVTFTPHVDTGDFVIVTNCEKVRFTGRKWQQKEYDWYTGYTGKKSESAEKRLERRPELIIQEAVRRMLPKSKLGRQMLNKLKVYAGPDHPHQAQLPETKELGV